MTFLVCLVCPSLPPPVSFELAPSSHTMGLPVIEIEIDGKPFTFNETSSLHDHSIRGTIEIWFSFLTVCIAQEIEICEFASVT